MLPADIDGSHISALLLRMFTMYYPFLIEAGKVYKAVPPLYSIKEGKKLRYFTDNLDMIKFTQKTFLDRNDFKDKSKKHVAPKDVTKFFIKNADYIYFLERSANTYAVDPFLLEIVLYHYISNNKSIKFDKLKKEVSSAYRFMDVYKEKNGTITVRGTIDKSNLIIVSDKFFADCMNIIKIIESNDSLYYYLNGKKASIYSVMKVYKSTEPSSIQRYKGLGEMHDGQLGESTMYPENRTLIRYTLESAKDAINFIREYESDTKKILSEVGLVTRDDLID